MIPQRRRRRRKVIFQTRRAIRATHNFSFPCFFVERYRAIKKPGTRKNSETDLAQRYRQKKKKKKSADGFWMKEFSIGGVFSASIQSILSADKAEAGIEGKHGFWIKSERTPRFPKLAKACQLGRRRKGRGVFSSGWFREHRFAGLEKKSRTDDGDFSPLFYLGNYAKMETFLIQ